MSPESGRESKPRSFDLTHHETVEELRALPDAELERRHDAIVQGLSDSSMEAQERQLHIERAHAYEPFWRSARVPGRRRGWRC